MNWLPILLMALGLSIGVLVIIFLVKRKKTFLIPSILLLMISFILIGLSQTPDSSSDGWNNVIYLIFGVFFFIISILVTSIVLSIKAYKKNKD